MRVTPRTPAVIPAQAGTQRKTKHAIYPFREGGEPREKQSTPTYHKHPTTPPVIPAQAGTQRGGARGAIPSPSMGEG